MTAATCLSAPDVLPMSRQRRQHRKKLGPHPETQRDNYAEVRRALDELNEQLAKAMSDTDSHCGELHLVFVFKNGMIVGHKFVSERVRVAKFCEKDPLAFDAL